MLLIYQRYPTKVLAPNPLEVCYLDTTLVLGILLTTVNNCCSVAGRSDILGQTLQAYLGCPLISQTPLNTTGAVLQSHTEGVLRDGKAVCGFQK